MIYGSGAVREDNEGIIRELFHMCRTQIAGKRKLLKEDDLKPEELQQIQDDNRGLDLPAGWFFMGVLYCDQDGKQQELHPHTEKYIANFIAERNETIGAFNRTLVKARREEKKLFLENGENAQTE